MNSFNDDASIGWIAADAMSCTVAVALVLALIGVLTPAGIDSSNAVDRASAAGAGAPGASLDPVEIEVDATSISVAGQEFALEATAAWTAAIEAAVGDGAPAVVVGVGEGASILTFDRILQAAQTAGAVETRYVVRRPTKW